MAEVKDAFTNQAYLTVTETGLNTLTFAQLLTGISIYEKVAWIISRLEYRLQMTAALYAATLDGLEFGLSVSDQISTVDMSANAVVDCNYFNRIDLGAAATGAVVNCGYTKSFSELPGGGLLIPPNPIFIFAKGTSLPAATTVQARMYYTVKQLKVEDFWELVEMRRMIGG